MYATYPLQVRGFIVWLKRKEVGHKERVAEYKHSVSYINSILEGVPQCFINMRILSFKFKSNKDAESGKIVEMAQTIFGKDCDMSVQLLGLKAIMTGITAVIAGSSVSSPRVQSRAEKSERRKKAGKGGKGGFGYAIRLLANMPKCHKMP